jgi:hypothetical protein
VAFDSITEDTLYGELLENTLDNFSEFERFMIADRMRRGKRSKGRVWVATEEEYTTATREGRALASDT